MELLLTAAIALASLGLFFRSGRKAAREHVLNYDMDLRDQSRSAEQTMEAPQPKHRDL